MKKYRTKFITVTLVLMLALSMVLAACGSSGDKGNSVDNGSNGQPEAQNNKDAEEQNAGKEKDNQEDKPDVKDVKALEAADAVLAAFDEALLPSFSLKLYGAAENDENYFIPGLAGTLINGTSEPVEELEYAEDYAFYIPKGAQVFEVDVVKVENSDNIQKTADMLNRRLTIKDDGNVRLYNPEEIPLLENAEVVIIGNYVILLVTDDNETAKEALNKLLLES